MANEPDNLILVHLREIRATLAAHSARFDRIDDRFTQIDNRFARIDERFAQIDGRFVEIVTHMNERFAQVDERFAQMDRRFDDLRNIIAHTFALSATNSLTSRQHDQLHQFSEGEQERITKRIDELEQRVVKVEKKLES